MKTVLAISAVILVLALVFFRFRSESGMVALQRCKAAVGEAKSWTVETTSQPESPSFTTFTDRTKVSCPDGYEHLFRSRTPDNVLSEQSTVRVHGVTYVENEAGGWQQNAYASNPQISMECGRGPLLVQQTVFNAVIELPRRKAGKLVKGELQTIDGVKCQEWSVDYGNEWPQIRAYTICIETKTHLPRRITFAYPGATDDFTAWNNTTVETPPL
jgi:hypothetical protein